MTATLILFCNIALPAAAEPKLTPLQNSVRAVVQGVMKRAEANSKRLDKLSRDALTCDYIRTAAGIAADEPAEHRTAAFLIGIGIALDDSPLLRTNILTRGVCAGVESEQEAKARRVVLGDPTIRNRRDLCQHYVVSMALTAILGADAAESAGVAKELLDMKGTSGFSFVDLAADFAGIELAKRVQAEPAKLAAISKEFQLDHHIPNLKGLREGFNDSQFRKEFGSINDTRYKDTLKDIRERIARLEAFRKEGK